MVSKKELNPLLQLHCELEDFLVEEEKDLGNIHHYYLEKEDLDLAKHLKGLRRKAFLFQSLKHLYLLFQLIGI